MGDIIIYGNPALGTSWSFVVDKNAVQWSQNNHVINQSEGVASNFNMDLTNNGAIAVNYEFIDLPVWLSVSNDPGSGSLNYGFTHTISFETAQWLNPGEHETYVKARILDPNGGVLGVEQFFLEVNVACPEPAYSFDPNAYPDQISLTAQLIVGGEVSQDEDDKVYAYRNGQLRGIGQVSLTGGQYLVSMIIYGNIAESGQLDFKVWDATDCKEYQGVVESYNYQAGVNIGSLAAPVPLTTGTVLSKSLPLSAGFPWVSFNLMDSGQSSLSLNAVTGFNSGDQITDHQGNTATYDQSLGWAGNLTTLDYKQHYLLTLTQATTLEFQGNPVSENTDIPVVAGTTWAGYIPEEMILAGRALISLGNTTATNGDQVQGKEGYAEFFNGEWIGSLTHLTPGRGYRLSSAQAGTLNYLGIAGYGSKEMAVKDAPIVEAPRFKVKDKAAARGWAVNANHYPEAMYITGVIEDDNLDTEQEYIIGAFAGDVSRGVAIPQMINGKLHYFMTVYGHTDQDELTFKLIDGQSGKQYLLSNTLGFAPGQSKGTYNAPYQWKLAKGDIPQSEWDYRLYQAYPNPFSEFTTIEYELLEVSEVEIVVVDMSGRIVKTLVSGIQERGMHQVEWYRDSQQGGRVAAGLYIIRMQTPSSTLYHKVIVK